MVLFLGSVGPRISMDLSQRPTCAGMFPGSVQSALFSLFGKPDSLDNRFKGEYLSSSAIRVHPSQWWLTLEQQPPKIIEAINTIVAQVGSVACVVAASIPVQLRSAAFIVLFDCLSSLALSPPSETGFEPLPRFERPLAPLTIFLEVN